MADEAGIDAGPELHRKYRDSFPPGYQADVTPREACSDVNRIEEMIASGAPRTVELYEPEGCEPGHMHFMVYSFDEPLVLLLGGRDKDLPWNDLATLVNERVKHVILFGEAAELIGKAIDPHMGTSIRSVTHCQDLEQAVHTAAELVKPGDIVLLSPGGTSFDAFRDFAERGEQYRVWVNELP